MVFLFTFVEILLLTENINNKGVIMFEKKTELKNAEQVKQDLETGIVVSSIYKIILDWWKLETENAEKGTNHEQKWLEAVLNFDFSILKLDTFVTGHREYISASLNEMFTATEQCFVPNRIKLLTSQLTLRFGCGVIELLNSRLKQTLMSIYGIPEDKADIYLEDYPCLWVIHIVQGAVLHIS